MRLIIAVFDALKTFDRPATRRELERESGMTKDEMHAGLRGLSRRDLLIKEVLPRQGGTYRLRPGAERPQEMRGVFVRSAELCERHRQIKLHYYASQRASQVAIARAPRYNPATPSAPSNSPGALRVVVKGVLDVRSKRTAGAPVRCALADVWKKSADRK